MSFLRVASSSPNVFLEGGLVQSVRHVGGDETGGDGIYRDLLLGHFLGERLGGGDEAALGRRIVRLARQTLESAQGCHVDDPPVFMQQHRLENRLRYVEETV